MTEMAASTTSTAAASIEEVMAVALSRELGAREHVFVGLGTGDRAFIYAVGIPTVAAQLAIERGADISLQYGTLFDPDLIDLPPTLGDPDLLRWDCAARVPVERCLDVFRRGLMTASFISGAQIDPYGNLNSVRIGREGPPAVRLTGPIAQTDHAVFAQRTFILMPHQRRVFVEKVDFVSAPGHGDGPGWRTRQGLPGGGPAAVITDKAVLDFDDATRRMRLRSIHPGVTLDEVLEATGFELLRDDVVASTTAPTQDELASIRDRIDAGGKLLQAAIK
jgi:glutaconate CoA-transferase subunit B